MSLANGHTNSAATQSPPIPGRVALEYNRDEIRKLAAELEMPFDPRVVEWRVCSKSDFGGKLRGQLVAYADSRAYQDRLNAIFTPAGWTRRYERQFSGEVIRDWDGKTVSKVFVTCELTIHGLGSNSSTGEAWADDDNAGTAAEAQAFKRAAACFGLGRYLYDVEKVWIDLDDRKRPTSVPGLPRWATPDGWAKGLRPESAPVIKLEEPRASGKKKNGGGRKRSGRSGCDSQKTPNKKAPNEIVSKIEQMHPSLGSSLYRGILKRVAKIWNPTDMRDAEIEKQVLSQMEEAQRLRRRFDAALEHAGEEEFRRVLGLMQLRSFHQIDSVEMLARLVREMEARLSQSF